MLVIGKYLVVNCGMLCITHAQGVPRGAGPDQGVVPGLQDARRQAREQVRLRRPVAEQGVHAQGAPPVLDPPMLEVAQLLRRRYGGFRRGQCERLQERRGCCLHACW